MKTEDEITWKEVWQDQWFYKLWKWLKSKNKALQNQRLYKFSKWLEKQKNTSKDFTKKEISKGEKVKTKS